MEIKKVIKRHGYTQRDVAEKIGVSASSLNNCIRLQSISPKVLHKIADAIGADYSEFFEDEAPMREQLRVEREQLELKRLRLQHKMNKSPDMIPVAALGNTIEGSVITLGGRRYKQVFIPLDE